MHLHSSALALDLHSKPVHVCGHVCDLTMSCNSTDHTLCECTVHTNITY